MKTQSVLGLFRCLSRPDRYFSPNSIYFMWFSGNPHKLIGIWGILWKVVIWARKSPNKAWNTFCIVTFRANVQFPPPKHLKSLYSTRFHQNGWCLAKIGGFWYFLVSGGWKSSVYTERYYTQRILGLSRCFSRPDHQFSQNSPNSPHFRWIYWNSPKMGGIWWKLLIWARKAPKKT